MVGRQTRDRHGILARPFFARCPNLDGSDRSWRTTISGCCCRSHAWNGRWRALGCLRCGNSISIDRVLWAIMLMFVVIQWRLGNVRLSRLTRIDWMVIAFVGYLIVNAVAAGFGPYGTLAVSRWLFYVAMPAGVYLVARVVDIRESDIRWFFTTMIVTSLYLAVTAVFEWRELHQFVFPRYITDPKVLEFYGRGRGPLMNPIANGFIINFGVIACVLGFMKSDRRMKLVYLGLGLVLLAGAYATLTRSIWLGVVLSVNVA